MNGLYLFCFINYLFYVFRKDMTPLSYSSLPTKGQMCTFGATVPPSAQSARMQG